MAADCRAVDTTLPSIVVNSVMFLKYLRGMGETAVRATKVDAVSMAPHACEGPIGGLATLHVNRRCPTSWCR
jgi:hypothetical protein